MKQVSMNEKKGDSQNILVSCLTSIVSLINILQQLAHCTFCLCTQG